MIELALETGRPLAELWELELEELVTLLDVLEEAKSRA